MPYYATVAALGSRSPAALVLYFIAEKAGEAFFTSMPAAKREKIKEWVDNNGFLSAFIPRPAASAVPVQALLSCNPKEFSQVPLRKLSILAILRDAACATASKEFSPSVTVTPPSPI